MLEKTTRATTSALPKDLSNLSLKKLAAIDPEIRGFLRAIKETNLREKAVELLNREILLKKSN